jgi:hypothetical protein
MIAIVRNLPMGSSISLQPQIARKLSFRSLVGLPIDSSSSLPDAESPSDHFQCGRRESQFPGVQSDEPQLPTHQKKPDTRKESDDNRALKLINWITDKGINGVPLLYSAKRLAQEYQTDSSYPGDRERIDSLIKWETTKNFTSGFITGLGGVITLPVAIPAAFGASWLIQARMAAAVALIGGHDIASDRVKTFLLACLAGDACKDILKDVGIRVGNGMARVAIQKIPGQVLIEINKRVGFRLLTKAGEKGAVNLMRMVPVVGGLVCGTFDGVACRVVGKQAKRLFYSEGMQ